MKDTQYFRESREREKLRDSRPVFIQSPLLEKLGHRKAARQLLFSKLL